MLAAFVLPAQAQTYANSWIVPGQQYYKIGTTKDGIYRLSYDWLTTNIPAAAAVNPQDLKLYRRGQQQAIYIEGEADGQLNPGDFLEFYGQRNDGKLDVEIYKNPQHHKNPYYSMFTDTAAYFLTWSSAPGSRMAVSNPSPAGLTPETYHLAKSSPFNLKDLGAPAALAPYGWPTQYSRGKLYSTASDADNGHSWGDESEMWGFPIFPNSNARNYRVDSLFNMPTGADTIGLPKPTVRVVVVGANKNTHILDILVGRNTTVSQMRRVAADITFGEFDAVEQTYTLNFRDFALAAGAAPSSLVIRLVPKNGAVRPDRLRFILAEVIYPQKFDLAGKARVIYPDPNKPVSHFLVQNPPADAIAYDISDLQNITRITGTPDGAQESFVFTNNNAAEPKLYVCSGQNHLLPQFVRPAAFANISASDRDYLIISHKTLMQPAGNSSNPVQDYADYRAGLNGGSYKTVIAEIEQIYNQFHYGEKSSMAIRNYIDYMRENSDLKFVFLLGKGLQMGFSNNPNCTNCVPYRVNPTDFYEKDLVPTFGFPGSDLVYVMDFKNNDYHIKTPIGRIAAQTSQDALNYLDKVKGYESQPQNAFWRKNILHLGGGYSPVDMALFKAYLKSYQALAEGTFLGANVIERYKVDAINPVEVVDVDEEVNAGLSLITFFGHSSPTVSDLDIGFVSDPNKEYNNFNKYPAILMNGCATGNSYNGNNGPESDSFGEDWTLTKDKGAVIFMAHGYQGFPQHFDRLMTSFYQAAFKDSTYGAPIGIIQKQTWARELVSGIPNVGNLQSYIALLTQYALQGDPAVALYGPRLPDYDITFEPLQFANASGGPITAEADSFRITIPIRNQGKALPLSETISIAIKRTFADNSSDIDTLLIPNVHYKRTVSYTFASGGSAGGGYNSFEVFIDNINAYEEISENNNKATIDYFIPLTGVAALFPYEFSIVPTQQVTLKGQAYNMSATNQRYIFEIDTSGTFTTGWKQTSPVITANMLPTWTVNLLPNPNGDSIEYFWRVRYNDIAPGEDPLWSVSSFTHIPNSPSGWAQGHPQQFKRDGFEKISQNENTREWTFAQKKVKLDLKTVGGGIPFYYPPYGILINEEELFDYPEFGVTSCAPANNAGPRFLVVVLDPLRLSPYVDSQFVCGDNQIFHTFPTMNSSSSQDGFAGFLNGVPDGHYIAMVSMNNIQYSGFNANLQAAFAAIGVPNISSVPNGSGYSLVVRKNNNSFAKVERFANPADTTAVNMQAINSVVELSAPEMPGVITSTLIGPAMEWGSLFRTITDVQAAADEVQLSVYARALTGQDTLIFNDVNANSFSLAGVNANQFPYLRLELTVKDSIELNPAQLQRWLVTYTPAPEGIARPDILGTAYYNPETTVEAGQQVSFDFKFQNITDINFRDDVVAVVTLMSGNQNPQVDSVQLGPLPADSMITFNHTFNTATLAETNNVLVYVNPRLQPEQYYNNNIIEASFKVRQDKLHPIIDVVFDGKHIMDGDIIAPNPTIVITLKDENKFRFKDDTVGIKVELVRNAGASSEFREVIQLQNNPEVQVQYATANSDFKIIYEPEYLPDGNYTLEVQGEDKTGNMAGTAPYRISFKMINASTITQFYPYPNPFSNSCRFVFTLTGQPELTKMKIQILTVTGKVVREITSAELGTFKTGQQITDYAWDGTDEFGDKLANGVYLYRVVIGDRGDNFKEQQHDSAESAVAAKAFKKGYGKLYILR